jgi:hypothetical protein
MAPRGRERRQKFEFVRFFLGFTDNFRRVAHIILFIFIARYRELKRTIVWQRTVGHLAEPEQPRELQRNGERAVPSSEALNILGVS